MQRLSVKLKFACGEPRLDELHLQHRMDRARWRLVHSVRGRKVQGVDRISSVYGLWGRDVFYSSKFDMHSLSIKLQLASEERSFDELHLQHRMDWMDTFSVFVEYQKYSGTVWTCVRHRRILGRVSE
jgi:hypothetical protein